MIAVQQNGTNLQYVPYAQRTAALCLAAVRQNSEALEYVPAELQDAVRRALQNAEEEL
jgi:hypothetical protein